MKLSKQTLTYLAAVTAMLLWASAFPATRYVLQFYTPVTIMLLRFTAASITLIIIGIIRKMRVPGLRDMPLFIASGISGVILYSYLFTTGSVTVVSGISSFIISTSPVFTLILSRIFLKEKVKLICWIGVAVSFIGLAAVTLTQITEFTFNLGVFLLICAAVSSGIYTIVIRKISLTSPDTKETPGNQKAPYTALEATTYTILIGTISMVFFIPDVIREIPDSNLTVNLLVILMGVFPSGLAYLAWSYALATADKLAHITVFTYLIPFISALIAYFWLHETLTVYALIGGVIIIAGMLMTNFTAFRKSGKTE